MAHKKPLKACSYVLPHPQHVWTNNPTDKEEKFFCKGVATPEELIPAEPKNGDVVFAAPGSKIEHVHAWDAEPDKIIVRTGGFGGAVPWQGPFECSCGKSRWLKDGRATEERFPVADSYDRVMFLKAKLDRGEEFTAEDKAELEAIAAALMEALAPLIVAFEKMYEQMAEFITSFLDKIDPVLMAQLIEMSKAHGEKPDRVETVELMGSDGQVIAEHIVSYDPISANQHAATDIVEDSEQRLVEPEPFPAADGEAIGITVGELSVNVIPDSPQTGAFVRALHERSQFRRSSEH
ncbi:hypothetical protein SEA_KARATE_81 [Microbacterium phage Karate]|nr:hypothetical protein SEA_KARATE_81 [Microbacterium phage Karate]